MVVLLSCLLLLWPRLLDLVVHPSCQTPQPLLSPPRPPTSWAPPKSISKAPELSLLQTPQVVKVSRQIVFMEFIEIFFKHIVYMVSFF